MPYIVTCRIDDPDNDDAPEQMLVNVKHFEKLLTRPSQLLLSEMIRGFPIPEKHLPKTLTPMSRRKLPDFTASMSSECVVSERAKSVIEPIAVGQCAFFPVEIKYRKGGPEGNFYWLSILARADTVAVGDGLARIEEVVDGDDDTGETITVKRYTFENGQLALSSAKIAELDLWREDLMGDRWAGKWMFISDRLGEAIKKAGLTGLKFKHVPVV